MKLNNKGMTLVELLISIVLIGVVLLFLFQLLLDIKDETDNNNFAYNNQVQRAEAIYTIQSDINKHSIVNITEVVSQEYNAYGYVIKIYFDNNKYAVIYPSKETTSEKDKYYLNYLSYDGIKYAWEMKDAIFSEKGYLTYDFGYNYTYIKINMPIYNAIFNPYNCDDTNDQCSYNNQVDDIEITKTEFVSNINIDQLGSNESKGIRAYTFGNYIFNSLSNQS